MKQKFTIYRKPNPTTTAIHVSKSLLNASTSTAQKVFHGFEKHQYQTNFHLQRRINIMELSQNSNFTIAGLMLSIRRTESGLERHWRLVKNGYDDSRLRITLDWIIDHLLYVRDVIWAIFGPILTLFLIVIVQLTVTLATTVGVVYLIYIFITL